MALKPTALGSRKKEERKKDTGEVGGVCVCGGVKPDLVSRNITINSDAAPNYKHMLGPHMSPLPHSKAHVLTTQWMSFRSTIK